MLRIWAIIIASLSSSAVGNVVLKSTIVRVGPGGDLLATGLAVLLSPWFWCGLALYGIGFVLWLKALAVVQLGRVYPVVVSLSFLIILTASIFVFGEAYSLERFAGVALIALGVALCVAEPAAGKKVER